MFDVKEIRNSMLRKFSFKVLMYMSFIASLYFLVKEEYVLSLIDVLAGTIFHLLYKLQQERDNSRVMEGMIILMVGDNEEILDKVEETYKEILEKDLEDFKKGGE